MMCMSELYPTIKLRSTKFETRNAYLQVQLHTLYTFTELTNQ